MLNIVIFTAEDYTFLFNAWCDFIDRSKQKYKITGIFVFPDIMKNKKGINIYLEYLKIMGFCDFIKLAIRSLMYRLKNKNNKYKNFNDLAIKNNIPVFYKNNPNGKDVVEWVKNNETDVILITFGYIVKPPLIEAVKINILNKHSALLPSFRGIWPVFWAMFYGGDIGATIHKVEIKIDSGETILQKRYEKRNNASVFDWYGIIYKDMADLFLRGLENLETGKYDIAYAGGMPSYYSLPTREEYKEFKKKGLKFV